MPGEHESAGHGHLALGVEADALADAPSESQVASDTRERLYEEVLTHLPQGVLIVDRELAVVFVNPAAQRLIGAGDSLRAGRPLPEPWPEFSLRQLAEGLFTRRPSADRHLVEADGKIICVEGLAAAHAPTATLLLDDVTERERTRRSERRFVENAAHELRTPLAAIISVIDALESGAKDVPESRDRFLGHLRASSERLSRLATSLLVLARIQTRQEQPHLELVLVESLIGEIASGLAPAAGVSIDVRAPKDIAVLADRDLLYQALENVAANAVKHTREGEIVLEARNLGRTVEIEITDTGSGMKQVDALHAFDRFYRSGHRELELRGFGLGLAIADEAIAALGGTITLDSGPEAGTRVRIRLPSAKLIS